MDRAAPKDRQPARKCALPDWEQRQSCGRQGTLHPGVDCLVGIHWGPVHESIHGDPGTRCWYPYPLPLWMEGEQWTMFFQDPSGNHLEFKAMTNPRNLFIKYNVAEG